MNLIQTLYSVIASVSVQYNLRLIKAQIDQQFLLIFCTTNVPSTIIMKLYVHYLYTVIFHSLLKRYTFCILKTYFKLKLKSVLNCEMIVF